MKPLGYVRMVLWSFFGIRRSGAAGEELASAKPVIIIVTALILAAVFGVSLWALASYAASSLH
jgi:hypothetical protein